MSSGVLSLPKEKIIRFVVYQDLDTNKIEFLVANSNKGVTLNNDDLAQIYTSGVTNDIDIENKFNKIDFSSKSLTLEKYDKSIWINQSSDPTQRKLFFLDQQLTHIINTANDSAFWNSSLGDMLHNYTLHPLTKPKTDSLLKIEKPKSDGGGKIINKSRKNNQKKISKTRKQENKKMI